MKKLIICLFACAFMASIASMAIGRTIEEERQAVRDYLNVVDAKLATAKEANNKKRVQLLHVEKAATLARWNKLRAEMEAAKPVVIATPEVVMVGPSTKEVGRGVNLYLNGGLDSGLTGFSANLDYDLSGLPAPGLKLRLGANYVSGTNPLNNDQLKAASAKIGLVYYITHYMPDMSLPLSWYIGGAGLYPVKVNDGRSGKWGAEAYLGMNYNIAELGIINVEVGYGVLKYDDNLRALRGLNLKIGYGITF